MKASIAERIQSALRQENLDGWLFYSFHGSDPIAGNIGQRDHARLARQRWLFFAHAVGESSKLVHSIESDTLDALPAEENVYLPWQQLHSHLADISAGSRRVAMKYCPLNAILHISRVDDGTVELVQSFGVDVVSSEDPLQIFETVGTGPPIQTHVTPILSL